MHDWSDNELDGMSREAADNYGPGRGMPDWDTLQKQLDKELPERKEDNRRRFFFLIFLCLVLTGVTGYLLLSQNGATPNQKNQIVSTSSQNSNKEKNDVDGTIPAKNNNAGSGSIDQQKETEPENRQDIKDDKAQTQIAPDKLSKSNNVDNSKTRSALSLSTAPQTYFSNPSTVKGKNVNPGKGKKKNSDDEVLAITVEAGGVKRTNTSGNEIEQQKRESAIDNATALTELEKSTTPEISDATKTITDKDTADQQAIAKDTVTTDVSTKKALTVKSPPKGSAIEISLLAGVDASSVKFKYGDNAGLNAGVLLGYRFNKKWSVGTGLIYTQKNYTAAGTDFNPPKGYWTNGIKLDKVDGSCYMWEVPVYASYRFNSNRKSGWFISMGLSSYFMTKENYTYHYKYMNGNPASRYWQNTDPSNYWFSILGISGGWEKNIGRGLSLGVAPYAKIPLKGVGFGNMSLSSYGVNLLLTYRKATGRK